MRVWPNWIDSRDGEKYELTGFANGPCPVNAGKETTYYTLRHRSGGLNIVSPAPGLPGCTIEQDMDRARVGPTKRDKIMANTDDENIMFLSEPEFDEAIVGLDYYESRVVYDQGIILEVLMYEMGLSYEEAVEHFDFNIAGSRGDGYPLYLQSLR